MIHGRNTIMVPRQFFSQTVRAAFCAGGFAMALAQQTPGPVTGTQTRIEDTQIIDGRKAPDQIPDSTAWWLLFQVLADRPGGLSYDQRIALLADLDLLEWQKSRLIPAANRAIARVSEMEKEARRMFSPTQQEDMTVYLRNNRDRIVTEVVSVLKAEVTQEGADKLQQYLREKVKRSIRMAPLP
jgi:hypothetical protein